MPRDSSGNYTLPAGNPVVGGTVISATWANPTMSDIAFALTHSLSRDGEGGMLAPFKFADGTLGAPGISWNSEPTSGFFRAGGNDMQAVIAGVPRMRWTASSVDVWDTGAAAWLPIIGPLGSNFALTNSPNVFTVLSTNEFNAATTFNATITQQAAAPIFNFVETDQGVDAQRWRLALDGSAFRLETLDAGGSNARRAWLATRVNNAVTNLSFGNATDNTMFTFLGTGNTTFGSATVSMAGNLTVAANSFFGTTTSLSVGNTARVQQFGTSVQGASHSIVIGSADTVAPRLAFGKTRSVTYDGLTPVVSGDGLGSVQFYGADGSTLNTTGAQILAVASGPVSTGVVPGELRFVVASTAGAQTERFRFSNFGGIGIAGSNYGTAGQVLTSGGAAAPVAWSNPALVAANFANPSASLGLAAINGVAITAMRSDGAPALSQSIAPTWTASHIFSKTGGGNAAAIQIAAAQPALLFRDASAAADEQKWQVDVSAKHFRGLTVDNADAVARLWLDVTRGTGAAVTNISFGNATDNPTYSFLGTGAATFNGSITSASNASGTTGSLTLSSAVPGILFRETDGGANGKVWLMYVDASACNFYLFDDSNGLGGNVWSFARTGTALNSMSFGNGTNNPTYTFQGTGTVTGASFTTTSSRAIKRETGKPRKAWDILSRLRPILYRLLTGDDREQLGLIAEEVAEVCPQLSDGKTVAYDRLALLLLAAWQEERSPIHEG